MKEATNVLMRRVAGKPRITFASFGTFPALYFDNEQDEFEVPEEYVDFLIRRGGMKRVVNKSRAESRVDLSVDEPEVISEIELDQTQPKDNAVITEVTE